MKSLIFEKSTLYLKQIIEYLAKIITKAHAYILTLNDKFEAGFSDKELHFIVIAIVGMIMMAIVYPFFKWLIKKNKVECVVWIYVFSLLVAITLLIELGQRILGTGTMDFKDIVAGLMGFIIISILWFGVAHIFRKIYKILNKH